MASLVGVRRLAVAGEASQGGGCGLELTDGWRQGEICEASVLAETRDLRLLTGLPTPSALPRDLQGPLVLSASLACRVQSHRYHPSNGGQGGAMASARRWQFADDVANFVSGYVKPEMASATCI